MRRRDTWLWRLDYAGRAIRSAVGVLVEMGLFILFTGLGVAAFALAYWLVWG